jgi:hypothetical protein
MSLTSRTMTSRAIRQAEDAERLKDVSFILPRAISGADLFSS